MKDKLKITFEDCPNPKYIKCYVNRDIRDYPRLRDRIAYTEGVDMPQYDLFFDRKYEFGIHISELFDRNKIKQDVEKAIRIEINE